MASINGLSVKGLKKFAGHEGEPCFQGNLYLGKKKIGFWSQNSRGCIQDDVTMEEGFSEMLLNKQITALNEDKTVKGVAKVTEKPYAIEYDLTHLMTDYLSLADDEKLFKKAVKKGYSAVMILTDDFHVTYYSLPANYAVLTDEQLKKKMEKEIEEIKKSMLKNVEMKVKIYRSLDDFNIGTAINLDDIRR